ncbi:hypothetical protein [Syntrophotalea acetylenica]|uniref:hypothetical protein n=1 Tax=Syntrophotalea acetylenica TaxID=29542 RepID=UPI0011AB463F|nr:hypothetical protein [Syntrophotalea acetylenica]
MSPLLDFAFSGKHASFHPEMALLAMAASIRGFVCHNEKWLALHMNPRGIALAFPGGYMPEINPCDR